jgi:chaperonin cofactor prefoldin
VYAPGAGGSDPDGAVWGIDEEMSKVGRKDEALLKEIRDNFDYCVQFWRETREEGDKDMRYASGDPWDPKDKEERKDKRPCVAFDELGQYLNQLINDVRQNKRAVKVNPTGRGATDKTAEFRGNLIRQIEYASRAQAVYSQVMENVTMRGYGYARVSKRYVAPNSFDQELVIGPIANPNTVWIDPDAKQKDRSDMGYCFITDLIRRSEFKRRWPKAEVTDFSTEQMTALPMWVKADFIQIAEYWRIEETERMLLSLDIAGGLHVFADELDHEGIEKGLVWVPRPVDLCDGVRVPKGKHKLLNQRDSKERHVVQYLTNAVEILEENPQDGKYIPIGCCFGKEKYLDEGGTSKLVIESLIRLARDAYMAYCFAQTTGLELLGMIPKAVWTMYEGQAEGHEAEWQHANRVPIPYLQVKAKTEATGDTLLPLPQWNHWDAPLAAVEGMAESYKRAIQSALGMYNTSVGKHDTNAQSGVAIKRLDDQSSQGCFHFIDNFDGFLEHMGRIMDDLIDSTYDTKRDVGIRTSADEHKVVRINEPFRDPKTGEEYHYRIGEGTHSVTITTGPSFQSEREAANEFADALAQNPQIMPRIADLVVKLKNLGPIGDEIAERLVPPDVAAQKGQQGPPLPPQAQQMMAAQKQQLMQQAQMIAELKQQLDAKLPDIQAKKDIVAIQEETKRQAIQSQIRIAELQAGVQKAVTLLETQVGAIQHTLEMMDSQAERDHEAALAQQEQDAAAAAGPPEAGPQV